LLGPHSSSLIQLKACVWSLPDLCTTHSRRTAQTEAIPTWCRFVQIRTWPSGQVEPQGHGFRPGARSFSATFPNGVKTCGCPFGQQTSVLLHSGPQNRGAKPKGSFFVPLARNRSIFLGNRYFTFHRNRFILLPEVFLEDPGTRKIPFRNRRSPSLEHRNLAYEVRASWRLSFRGL
jgi:hypothetical protein